MQIFDQTTAFKQRTYSKWKIVIPGLASFNYDTAASLTDGFGSDKFLNDLIFDNCSTTASVISVSPSPKSFNAGQCICTIILSPASVTEHPDRPSDDKCSEWAEFESAIRLASVTFLLLHEKHPHFRSLENSELIPATTLMDIGSRVHVHYLPDP